MMVALGSVRFYACHAAPTVTQIAAGGQHTLFVKSIAASGGGKSQLWAVGRGSAKYWPGYTAIPKQILASGVTAVAAGNFHSMFRKSDGSLWVMGDDEKGQLGDGRPYNSGSYYTNLPEMIVSRSVSIIAAGGKHSLFSEFRQPIGPGSLWSMGENFNGQLGMVPQTKTNTPQEIIASSLFGTRQSQRSPPVRIIVFSCSPAAVCGEWI